MNLFGKKEEVAEKDPLNTAWDAYWAKKEALKALGEEISKLEKTLYRAMDERCLFNGTQTATLGLNKISRSERPKLIKPKNLDLVVKAFYEAEEDLCKIVLDESKIIKCLEDADARKTIEQYGFDVEYSTYLTFKKA